MHGRCNKTKNMNKSNAKKTKPKKINNVGLLIEHLDGRAGKTRLNYLVAVAALLLAAVFGPGGKARIAPAKTSQAHF